MKNLKKTLGWLGIIPTLMIFNNCISIADANSIGVKKIIEPSILKSEKDFDWVRKAVYESENANAQQLSKISIQHEAQTEMAQAEELTKLLRQVIATCTGTSDISSQMHLAELSSIVTKPEIYILSLNNNFHLEKIIQKLVKMPN